MHEERPVNKPLDQGTTATSQSRRVAAAWAGAWLLLVTGNASAQVVPAPAPAPEEEPEIDEPLSSTEQGQTHLDESFETEEDRRERIREQRRKALEDTKFDVQGRTFLLDRDKYDDTESYAWAIGGSAGLKTGYFRDRFAVGLTGYTSQPIDAPDDKDGTLLLALSWEDVNSRGAPGEAYNVVIHEFAHYLDHESGGAPWIAGTGARQRWFLLLDEALERLRAQTEAGERGFLDPYAAEDRGEFFAVASEAFFEEPAALARELPALYRALADVYRLDPVAWVRDVN
jgi:hypothetical protein